MSKTKKITFMYEIAVETDTTFKASLYQKFIETSLSVIQNYFKGKTNKVIVRKIGIDYIDKYE